jgi:hypothetical protein
MNSPTRLAVLLSLCLAAAPAFADETVPEKAKVVKNDAVRATKKAVHRAEETVCLKSDAKCLAEKAKHRATETKDVAVDKVDEVKNKVDTK